MVTLDQLAQVALERDNLLLRATLSELLREEPIATKWLPPMSADLNVLAIAASLSELIARRQSVPPPPWTENVPASVQTIYFVKAAETMHRLRDLCDEQSPPELRKRGFFAPPDFLTFA